MCAIQVEIYVPLCILSPNSINKYQILFSWLTLEFNASKECICMQFYVPMPTLSLNTLFKLMYIYLFLNIKYYIHDQTLTKPLVTSVPKEVISI